MKLKFLILLASSITNNATAFFVPTSQSCHHHQHQSIMKAQYSTHVDMIEEENTMVVEEEEKRRTNNPVGEEETTSSSSSTEEDIDIENIEEELSAALDEFVGFQQTHDAFLKNQQAPVASYPLMKRRKKEGQTTNNNYDYYIPVMSTNQPHANSLFLDDDISDITGLPFVSAATAVSSQQEIEMDPFGLEEEEEEEDTPTPLLIALNTFDDDDVVEGYEFVGTA